MKSNTKGSLRETANQHTWAIRGIEPETRTAATMAARRAGQTVGEWCNRALREAAQNSLKERVPGPTIEETLAKLVESMAQQTTATQQQNAAILSRLEAVEQRKQESANAGGGNLLGRFHGLLWRKQDQSGSTARK